VIDWSTTYTPAPPSVEPVVVITPAAEPAKPKKK
jgi:hypothetical protein